LRQPHRKRFRQQYSQDVRATVEEIVKRLAWIGEKEKIDVSEEALFAIGKRADGSIRDAESMLDQIRIYQTNRINLKDVEELLGIISSNIFFEYTEALTAGDPKLIFEFVDKIFSTGYDFIEFFTGLLEHFRLLIMVKLNINKNILGVAQAEVSRFESQSNKFSIEKLIVVMQHIADNEEIIKRTSEPKILFEILSLNLLNALALPQNSQSISGTGKTGEQQNLKTIWQGLITELSEKRPYLANHLELAQLSDVVDNKIVITCNQRHIKEFIESEKTEIESYFSLLLNRLVNISVTCTDEKNKDSRKFTNNEKTESPKPDVDSKISEEFSKGTETKSPDKIFKDLFPNSKKLK
jgi:DNA polymerase III gamma/tau subunit